MTLQCLKTCPQEIIMCCNSSSNWSFHSVICTRLSVWSSMLCKTSGVEQLAYLPSTAFRNEESHIQSTRNVFQAIHMQIQSWTKYGPATHAYSSMQPCASILYTFSLVPRTPTQPSRPLEAGEGELGYKAQPNVSYHTTEHWTTVTSISQYW